MPARSEHLEQARRNRAFAERILREWGDDETAIQWAVTAVFCAAVHYVDAYLAEFNQHPKSHEQRTYLLQTAPDDFYVAYRSLYDASRQARYDARRFRPDQVEALLIGVHLRVIASTLGAAY
ncbi:MAG TPA: hypothetical protein VFC93_04930 [Chloroflexota bacterium]|nr:hypothetical protein [Chloroflexota bacterium]